MNKIQRMLLAGAVALGTLGAAGVAQARNDVYWSVGVGSPGTSPRGADQRQAGVHGLGPQPVEHTGGQRIQVDGNDGQARAALLCPRQ